MKLREFPSLLRMALHLRTSQIIWRFRRMVELRLPPGTLPAPPFPGPASPLRPEPLPLVPLFRQKGSLGGYSLDALKQGEFIHLNHRLVLKPVMPDWQLGPRTRDRLWTMALHYHAWAYDAAAAARQGDDAAADLFRRYLSDWLERCRHSAPGARELAWNPYTIATRIGWWIRSYGVLGEARWKEWPDFRVRFLQSLWQQAAYLRRHLELDLRGNHLLRDAVGLAWAGRFFYGEEADEWQDKAREIALEQVREQVLPDGGHFERSPMYHAQVMEDILTLALLLSDGDASATLREVWVRMANFLTWVRHPDGQIPQLNDAALRTGCDPATLLDLGGQIQVALDPTPPAGGQHFTDTGLVVWHGKPWSYFFDVGPIGADHQPGHAHADSLTVECSYEGRRLIVDPGTYGYDNDDRRRYDRSTDAHNTVCIDGENSSEVWHIFRVGRRARTSSVRVEFTRRAGLATATHDGYNSLAQELRHERRVRAFDEGEMGITDRILGTGRHEIRGGLLLDPAWRARQEGKGWEVTSGERKVILRVTSEEEPALSEEIRDYHPEFGKEIRTTRLCWSFHAALPVEVEVVMEKA